jgi:hypothetical protein
VPANPLPLAELEALLADGQEVVCEQGAEPVGVAAHLSLIKGALELKDVVCHSTHPPSAALAAGRPTRFSRPPYLGATHPARGDSAPPDEPRKRRSNETGSLSAGSAAGLIL